MFLSIKPEEHHVTAGINNSIFQLILKLTLCLIPGISLLLQPHRFWNVLMGASHNRFNKITSSRLVVEPLIEVLRNSLTPHAPLPALLNFISLFDPKSQVPRAFTQSPVHCCIITLVTLLLSHLLINTLCTSTPSHPILPPSGSTIHFGNGHDSTTNQLSSMIHDHQ